jgi:3'-phosphoadenosine 5'-phosphosulfate sulfotransferase (PAPS reductase)/FAD synthetase
LSSDIKMFDTSNSIINCVDLSPSFSDFEKLASEFELGEPVEKIDPVIELEQDALTAFNQAIADIKAIRAQRVCQNALSFGKDSTLLLLASLEAHKQLIAEDVIDQDSPFVVSTIDTGVENHLMQILVHEEVDRLKLYCEAQGINLKVHFATPPLSKTWAALFLSGHKMLSTARLNNDCSVILKINSSERIEKEITELYGDVCILVGSRTDESARRAQSLQKRNQASRDVLDFLEGLNSKREDNVFAPISHITTDQVWLLLRRAGTDPIVKPSSKQMHVPSYADNHLLLAVIYGDSSDGTCPTTSKNVTGQGIGGCGKSSRTGCSLCLKVFKDTSGEAQNRLPRHSVISDNMLKVRNYMAFVAEDMSKRTWHTRAIDKTTGAIAAYPNVLNAQTIDELIKLLIQCTVDEHFRAKQFKLRVKAGDEMLDKGYADIINDTTLSDRERELFASVYKRHAQEPLHKPISYEICMYLSFIHSRDGIKLPPYRAIALWQKLYVQFIADVEEKVYEEYSKNHFINLEDAHKLVVKEYEDKGFRLPYPDVDINQAKRDSAPDAVMLLPDTSFEDFNYVPHTGLFNAEEVVGCMIDIEHDTINLPLSQASKLLPRDHNVTDTMVSLRGFKMDDSHTTFRNELNNVNPKKEFSKRTVAKVSRKAGNFKVTARGRTSVGSHSFSKRTKDTVLTSRLCSAVSAPKLSLRPHYIPLNGGVDDTLGTYELSFEGLCNWEDYGGFETAMQTHNDFISRKKSLGESIYYWSGVHVVEEMQRYGLFDLSEQAIKSSMYNLKRTAYFGSMGLFRLSDEAFQELASSYKNSEGSTLKKFEHLYVKSIMSMKKYRDYKANILIKIRADRNAERKKIKAHHQMFLADNLMHDLRSAEQYFESLMFDFDSQIHYYETHLSISNFGRSAIEAYAKYLSNVFSDEVTFARYLSVKTRKQMKSELNAKQKITRLRRKLYNQLTQMDSLSDFDIEWPGFKKSQLSVKQKPVEFAHNLVW